MKALVQRLEAWQRQRSPIPITAMAVGWVLAVGVADYSTPPTLSLIGFYALAVLLAGWGAGKWPALLVSAAAGMALFAVNRVFQQDPPQTYGEVLWNSTTYFLVLGLTGWLTADLTTLLRSRQRLVEERTGRWKPEAEQEKTREQPQLQALVLENMAEGVMMVDEANRIVVTNRTADALFGYGRGELLGQSVLAVSSHRPEEAQGRFETFLAHVRRHSPATGEYRTRRKDGTLVEVETRSSTVLIDGRPHLVVVGQDITQRKQAEQAIRESEASLRAFLDAMPFPAFLLDREGTILAGNSALALRLNLPREQVTGKNIFGLLTATPAAARKAGFDEVFGTRKPVQFEDERDGRHFINIASPVFDAAGNVIRVAVGALDITERKRAEKALSKAHEELEHLVRERTAQLEAANTLLGEREARLRLALEASNAGAWSWDVASNQSVWDDRYHELYGFDPQAPASFESWIDRVHPMDRERLVAAVQRLLEPGAGDRWNEEFRALHPAKGERWMAGLGRIDRDPSGRAFRFAGINLDITERKRAEQALREAHDLLDHRVQERTAELQAANTALRQSEERYRSLVDNLNVGVYRNQPGTQGGFIQANPALARMCGFASVEEFMKVRVADFYQEPRERQAFLAELSRQGSVANYELRLKKKDGTPFLVSINATVHRGPDGEVDWMDGMLEDITERKHTQALLQAQRDLGVVLSTTSDLPTALKRFLEFALDTSGIDTGGVYLLNDATLGFDLAEHRGGSPPFIQAMAHLSPDDIAIELLRPGRAVFTSCDELNLPPEAPVCREGMQAIAFVPLCHERKLIGALTLGSYTTREIPPPTRVMIEALAAQASGAIARVRAEGERHRLERQILEITDREQARIGQDIHDGLCQRLVSLAFDANALHKELSGGHRAELKTATRIAQDLDEAITEARQLSRGLFPVRLDQEGLSPALEELARATQDRFKIQCRFHSQGRPVVQGSTTATHLYRIAQEAVTNAVKHSRAQAITISLREDSGELQLEVEDTGRGIDPEQPTPSRGMGLHIMDYRARSIRGTVRISRGPRGGTVVLCCVPPQSG